MRVREKSCRNEARRLASGKRREYYGQVFFEVFVMRRHGITVLSLMLIIIALVIVAVLVMRYLRASGA